MPVLWETLFGGTHQPDITNSSQPGQKKMELNLYQFVQKHGCSVFKEEVYDSLEEISRKVFDEHPDACGFIGLANSPTCGMSAGVKKRGSTIRGAMHRVAEVPTCEVNQLKNETGRKSFLNRLRRYRSSQI